MVFGKGLYARRIAACLIDYSVELTGGFLGSYFGIMVAALLTTLKDAPAEEMTTSMWNGLGFGFVFWFLSVSFLNRVLVQGLSRSSIGKKLLKLELISTTKTLSWSAVTTRWLFSFISLAVGGLGYIYSLFDSEGRPFHDIIAHTDVVPLYEGKSISVEYREEIRTIDQIRQIMVLSSVQAELPSAKIIKFPVKPNVAAGSDEKTADEKKAA